MSIKEKLIETKNKAKEKLDETNKKYPWLKPVLIASGVALFCGGGYCLYKKTSETEKIEQRPDMFPLDTETTDEESPVRIEIISPYEYHEMLKQDWEENFRDNWDEVMECARRLDLIPGEMFIIEDQKQYIGDPAYKLLNPDMPIVSHLVNDVGCYPPEDLE